jgi:hypothetical protein
MASTEIAGTMAKLSFRPMTSSPEADLPRDAVAALTLPVLLVHGASTSELHRRGADELAAVLPDARRTVIETRP